MARIPSCGILARFSAQSVSITPVSGTSTAIRKPFSCQKSRTSGQTFSGGMGTTSQRCVPARSICMFWIVGSTPETALPVFACCARSAW